MSGGGFSRGPARVVYSGRFDVVEYDVTAAGTGPAGRVTRQVVQHPGAVTVAALEGDEITLLRQYRAAVDAVVTELPAGKLDAGEAPLDTAMRELEEETGKAAEVYTLVADYLVSPGWSDERMWLYLAEGIRSGSANPQGAEELQMEVVSVSLADAVEMVRAGTIRDAKSIVGVLLTRDFVESRCP